MTEDWMGLLCVPAGSAAPAVAIAVTPASEMEVPESLAV